MVRDFNPTLTRSVTFVTVHPHLPDRSPSEWSRYVDKLTRHGSRHHLGGPHIIDLRQVRRIRINPWRSSINRLCDVSRYRTEDRKCYRSEQEERPGKTKSSSGRVRNALPPEKKKEIERKRSAHATRDGIHKRRRKRQKRQTGWYLPFQ